MTYEINLDEENQLINEKVGMYVQNATADQLDSLVNSDFEYRHYNTDNSGVLSKYNSKDLIKFFESYRGTLERDVDGGLILGWGTKADDDLPLAEGDQVPDDIANEYFDRKFDVSVDDSRHVFHNYDSFDTNRQVGIQNISWILGRTKLTDPNGGFPNMIKEANKPNVDWNIVADEFRYVDPSKGDMTESKAYLELGDRGEYIYNLLKGDITRDEIIDEFYKWNDSTRIQNKFRIDVRR